MIIVKNYDDDDDGGGGGGDNNDNYCNNNSHKGHFWRPISDEVKALTKSTEHWGGATY